MKPFFEHAIGSSWLRPRFIRRNPKLNRPLRDTIELTSRDTFLVDGSVHSSAVYTAASIGGTGGVPGDWRGPVVVLRAQGCSIDPHAYLDITMDDFRCVMDHFLGFND
jgi:hypothetical protein